MKPLTIEELKALEVGDWVYLIINKISPQMHITHILCSNTYYIKMEEREKNIIVLDVLSGNRGSLLYSDYGTKWLAYKNKEIYEECMKNNPLPLDK